MTEPLSPRLSRAIAAALLLVAIWLSANVLFLAISSRISLQAEISDLRRRFADVRGRRVDIESLRTQLSALSTSAYLRNAAIITSSERAALGRLQQITRKSIEEVQGKLFSLVDLAGSRTSSMIGVQVRVRIGEPSLPQWINLIENGEPRVQVEEMTVMSRTQPSEPVLQLDVTATLRVRWLAEGGVR